MRGEEAWQESDEVVEVEVKRPLDKVVSVRLPSDKWEELRREALELGVGPTTLARMWVLEKLRQSSVPDGKQRGFGENRPAADITLDSILDAMGDVARLGDRYVGLTTRALALGSPAATEGARLSGSPPALELFDYILKRASQSLVAAGDAIRSLSRLLRKEPLKTSSGGVARDIIESAAACAWLTDATCDPNQRLGRVGSLWLKDLAEMRKLSNTNSATETKEAKAASAKDLQTVLVHEAKVREWLQAERIEAKGMIPSTQLVKDVVDGEFEYRLWSNLSHGNPYALQSIRAMHADTEQTALALHLTTASVDAYSRAVFSYVSFFRPDFGADLKARLNDLYDRLGMDEGEPRDFLK